MKTKTILFLATGLLAGTAWPADAGVGEKMVAEKNCAACHQRLVGGDGSKIYLRDSRRVKTLPQLDAQVRYCSNELETGWFPEDEAHVVAWLNHRYYKF